MIQRKHGFMQYENFKIITDKIRSYCKYLYLHNWGDPLLNNEIIKMIQYAATFTKTNISTNANMIDDALARQLIDSGVTDIIVSIDGATQDTYEYYRRGGNLERALFGLSTLNSYAKKRNSSLLRKIKHKFSPEFFLEPVNIVPQFCVFEHNYHEMDEFAAICKKLDLTPSFKAPYIRKNSFLAPSSDHRYVRAIADADAARIEAMRGCNAAFSDMYILLSGDVVACCYDHDGQICFGNIFQQSVEDIWSSELYQKFRSGLISGVGHPFCLNNCLCY